MSSESAEGSQPKKKKGLVGRIVSSPRRWSGTTWATVLFVIFLVLLTIGCWVAYRIVGDHVPWRHYMTWPKVLAILGSLVLLPFCFRRVLRLWLEGEAIRFPQLRKAWDAGIEAFREQGVKLGSTPLFVVLGSDGELQEKAIMDANDTPFSVVGVPKGPAPIHWYGNAEAVYLFCSDASCLSALNQLRRNIESDEAELVAASLDVPSDFSDSVAHEYEPAPELSVTGTALPNAPGAAPAKASQLAGASARGTIMLDQFVGAPAGGSTTTAKSSTGGPRGTMLFDQPLSEIKSAPASTTTIRPIARTLPAATRRQPIALAAKDWSLRLELLRSIGQRLRHARQPFCPVNGVLVLLPFTTIEATGNELEELERAIRTDLATVQQSLQLRAPVTALVVGLERETGFRELVRRVGREKSASQRFGGRYDVRSHSTSEHLRLFSGHVCGAFEDWVYTLFREQGALSRPGNARLYGLLCKVRCILKARLGDILAKGFGYDERTGDHSKSYLFSGCYFASTGRTADRQAFVRGVLTKLIGEQEQIEWTQQAISQDRGYRWLFYVGTGLDALLLGLLLALLIRSA